MILTSQCYCGDVNLKTLLSKPIENYTPRACDCDFCTSRNITYLSDPKSKLKIKCKNNLKRYQQGSSKADFLACGNCDSVVAVIFDFDGKTIGAVNATLFNAAIYSKFEKSEVVSPKFLTEKEKIKRWQMVWMEVEFDQG